MDTKKFFENVLDANEKLIWSDEPSFWPFMLQALPRLGVSLFGIVIFGSQFQYSLENFKEYLRGPDYSFLIFITIFVSIGFLDVLRLLLSYSNTGYALTDKRVLIRGGFWGTDFKSIDHDKITELLVDVNPIENILKVGTIKTFTGKTTEKGSRAYDSIIGIKNPYDIFKQFKTVSLDVKTDINYPNALRPDNNPGYNTVYEKQSGSEN